MDMNYSVWHHYRPNHVDPLYQPYQKREYQTQDGQTCNYNPYKPEVGPDVYPEHIRHGWGQAFQNKHSTWPCPDNFVKGEDNWCHPQEREFEPIFYTEKAFVPAVQFTDSPTYGYKHNNFDMRTVHPSTGLYEVYHKGHQPRNGEYKSISSRHSFVGGY